MFMHQFCHVNSYALKVSVKSKPRKNDEKIWSVQDVLDEATRKEGCFSKEITNPQPPIHIYGDPIEQIPETVADWAKKTKDSKGRKTRVDAKGLLAGVFSAEPGTPQEEWERIRADGVAWAKAKYGPRLRTIVEHIDEKTPHCHFYVVPLPGEVFETVHEGLEAKKAAMAAGMSRKDANTPYIKAMKTFLDEYHDQVGAPNGMTRIGPGRRRLTRKEWHAEKQQAEAIKQQHRKAEMKMLGADAVIENANLEAAAIKESASSTAKMTVEVAASEAEAIVYGAEVKSKNIIDNTKKSAGTYLNKANEKGYQHGIKKAEEDMQGTWLYRRIETYFQKIKNKLGIVEKERDALKAEIEPLRSYRDRFYEKAAELTSAMKKITGLESELERAEKKAALADKQEIEIKKLSNLLIEASDRNKHLDAYVESLKPKDEKIKREKPLRELGETGYSL
jgi:hypothetical protein